MQNQSRPKRNQPEGIELRHTSECKEHAGKCICTPTYQANVWSARERKRIRKTFKRLSEAKAWRQDAYRALRRSEMRAPSKTTLREAADTWLEQAKAGSVRTRSGQPYKPSSSASTRPTYAPTCSPRSDTFG